MLCLGCSPPGLQQEKVSMEENELERFFELEPVPSPSCAGHGRPRLFEGEMESRFDPDVPPP
jgi:hypothetical protein